MMQSLSLPSVIKPMLAVSGQPFDHDDFLFEIKWDGMRMLAFIDANGYRLLSRQGHNATERFPELAFLAGLAPGTVLDGEMVVLRHGQPNFALLQSREQTRSALKIHTLSQIEPASYIVFDLLYEGGVCLLQQPLYKRRQRLEQLVSSWQQPRLVLSPGVLGQGRALFAAVCGQGLEGIMAKRWTSLYRTGQRSRDWIKIKPRLTPALAPVR